MDLIRPFRGLHPRPEYVAQVIAPPYDVLTSAEARVLAAGRPWSFLHLSKPEIDLPSGTRADAPEVYARGRRNLEAFLASDVLVQDAAPCYYVYRLETPTHRQTGLAFAAAVAAYEDGRIRRHEHTRPAKEDDRTRMIEALGAQTGPVLLACRAPAALADRLAAASRAAPHLSATAHDGVRHSVWIVSEPAEVAAISAAATAVDALYIADGHHRAAAAARVARSRRAGGSRSLAPGAGDDAVPSAEGFLAVAFAHDALQVLDYNRVVTDLNGLTPEALLAQLARVCTVRAADQPVRPAAPGHFGMYLTGRWYELALPHHAGPGDDPVARLDVSLLQQRILGPILGIGDPRTDPRIDFIGGARGLSALAERVDSGAMAVAFALFPTRVEDVMQVSDRGSVMPPKSTWFEPKLADGLLTYLLGDTPRA